MNISVSALDKFKKIEVRDASSSFADYQQFKEVLNRLLEQKNYHWIINLDQARFVGTGIINSIFVMKKEVDRHQGEVLIVANDEAIVDILNLVQIDNIARVFKSEEEVLQYLGNKA